MPELIGIENHNGENKALIDFNNARKFMPYKDANTGQIKVRAVPNPHKALMGENDLKEFINAAKQGGKDPAFYRTALKQLEAHNAAHDITEKAPDAKTEPAARPKPQGPDTNI